MDSENQCASLHEGLISPIEAQQSWTQTNPEQMKHTADFKLVQERLVPISREKVTFRRESAVPGRSLQQKTHLAQMTLVVPSELSVVLPPEHCIRFIAHALTFQQLKLAPHSFTHSCIHSFIHSFKKNALVQELLQSL